jgi:hypothetical protein
MKSRFGILVAALFLCGSIGLPYLSTATGKQEIPYVLSNQEPLPSPSPSPTGSPTPAPEPEPVPTATPSVK